MVDMIRYNSSQINSIEGTAMAKCVYSNPELTWMQLKIKCSCAIRVQAKSSTLVYSLLSHQRYKLCLRIYGYQLQ